MQLENGKAFSIEAINQSDKNEDKQKTMMDGKKLVFVMGDKHNKKLFVQQY